MGIHALPFCRICTLPTASQFQQCTRRGQPRCIFQLRFFFSIFAFMHTSEMINFDMFLTQLPFIKLNIKQYVLFLPLEWWCKWIQFLHKMCSPWMIFISNSFKNINKKEYSGLQFKYFSFVDTIHSTTVV